MEDDGYRKSYFAAALCAAILVMSTLGPANGQLTGGSLQTRPCTFPFIYQGLKQDSCISHEHSQPWCATTRNYDADRQWRNCRPDDMIGLPRFLPLASPSSSAWVGDTARLTCMVHNLHQHSIVWSKRGAEYPLTIRDFVYTNDARVSVHHSESEIDDINTWTLLIENATVSDSGIYECRVTTRSILLHYDVRLAVAARPQENVPAVTLGEARSRTVDKGTAFSLQCNASSAEEEAPRRTPAAAPEVEWFKDGLKINSATSSSVLITNQVSGRLRMSTLVVERSNMEDAGTYICRTSEQMFAEIKVHVLNADKDNKKRGTLLDAKEKAAGLAKGRSSGSSSLDPPLGILLIWCLSLQLFAMAKG